MRYFWDTPNKPNRVERSLLQTSEDPKTLYDWLNGSEKILSLSNQTILALALPKALSDYPWESLNLIAPNLIPLRWGNKSLDSAAPKNRPLSVLFMAAQPDGLKSKLNHEQQENKILEGTKGYPLNLMVEESGWLRELQLICDRHQQDFGDRHQQDFDILHLTGVVDSHAGKACLLTEDQFGDRCYSSAEDIANAIGRPFPRLILLCADAEYSSEERKKKVSFCGTRV